MDSPRIQRALISVSDKLGLADFARGLAAAGVEIYSTGGTRKHLESEGIPVRDVSEYTGFPEMMDGRLKTLHPKVHGGILCRHDNPEDMKALAEHGILTFELVVVNLYPFEATVARKGVTLEEAIEQIDIGGPTLVRAAAKNHAFTTIATNAAQYSEILDQVAAHGCTTLELRRRLAGEAFAHTARYDRAIADFFAGATAEGPFPGHGHARPDAQDGAALRRESAPAGGPLREARRPGASVVAARQLHGKELSYNNLLDLDSALAIVRQFSEPAAVVIKHNNPCGAAVADTLAAALQRAMAGDPLSAFGSVLGLNRAVDAATAEGAGRAGAVRRGDRRPPLRRRRLGNPHDAAQVEGQRAADGGRRLGSLAAALDLPLPRRRRADAGGRRAARSRKSSGRSSPRPSPSEAQMSDLRFAWEIVRHVKSNAIVLCKDRMLLGTGAGQMSRVDSVGDRREEGGRPGRRVGAGLRRLLPLPRLDRHGRRGRRGRRHPARRLEERRRGHRRLQPPRHPDDLHRPAAFQALGWAGEEERD